MRKCIDMGKDGKIIINDKDMLKPDGTLEIPDIGLGEAYLGKASYVVYDEALFSYYTKLHTSQTPNQKTCAIYLSNYATSNIDSLYCFLTTLNYIPFKLAALPSLPL